MGLSSFMKVVSHPKNQMNQQEFKYFLVLDFEANCARSPERLDPQEIIEFPCLLVDSGNFRQLDLFHEYVRPVGVPSLTPFCTELTGITQDMVSDCPTFPEVLERFNTWAEEKGLNKDNSCFVTCGLWDLVDMLPRQSKYSGVALSDLLDVGESGDFINLKFSYQEHTGKYGKGLKEMQGFLGLDFQGRHHSGIDDCRNILLIMEELAKRGLVFQKNGNKNKK